MSIAVGFGLLLSLLVGAQTPNEPPQFVSPQSLKSPPPVAPTASTPDESVPTEVVDNKQVADNPKPETASALVDTPEWNCRIDSPPANEAFTVGEKFILFCNGPTVQLNKEVAVHFQVPAELLYAIKVLSADKITANEVILTATSYFPGQHELTQLVLVQDLEEKFKVKPFQLQVKSVIDNPQQPPYGPAGGVKLAYPKWLWIALVGGAVLMFFFVLLRLKRRAQRLRVLEELKKHNTAIGAYNQLNKDLRKLGQKHVFTVAEKWQMQQLENYLAELDELFRLYLLREFVVPALEWRSALVIREIASTDRIAFRRYGGQLTELLKELDRARSDIGKVKVADCKQLTQMARRVSQDIWQHRKGGQP